MPINYYIFSVYCFVLHRNRGCADTPECDHHFHVHRADAECCELVAGGIFKNASFEAMLQLNANSRNRWTVICIFYHGGGGGGSKCGTGNHCNDVPEYPFSGCEFLKQVETLISDRS